MKPVYWLAQLEPNIDLLRAVLIQKRMTLHPGTHDVADRRDNPLDNHVLFVIFVGCGRR